MTNVGLRAQATAVGLVQLCIKLRKADVLSEDALSNIKKSTSDELLIGRYRRSCSRDERRDVEQLIGRIFAGEQKMGSADELSSIANGPDEAARP